MNRWNNSLWRLSVLGCGVLLVAPAAARSQDSIAFNAVSTPVITFGTSKLENTTANVLGGSNVMTICAWVYADGPGENGGTLVALDEADSGITLSHSVSASSMFFRAKFVTSPGVWSFPVPDHTWNAVAVSYNKSNTSQVPTARINFTDVTETLSATPAGTAPSVNTGYCVGNFANQTSTWNGRIAHVQVFDRLLSGLGNGQLFAYTWIGHNQPADVAANDEGRRRLR